MNSRGRFLVKMCQPEGNSSQEKNEANMQQQNTSTINDSSHRYNITNSLSENNNHTTCNDKKFDVNITVEKVPDELFPDEDCKLAQCEEFKILTCESAPASVMITETFTTNIKPPQSAPMPVNISPISLGSSKINVNEDILYNNIDVSSPIRGSSPISGIEVLPFDTDEEPFASSDTSWIPDTDEENKLKRKRTNLPTSASSDMSPETKREKTPKKKIKVKKFESKRSILSSESEEETANIINVRAIIEKPLDQNVMTPLKSHRNVEKESNITIAETNSERDSMTPLNSHTEVENEPNITIAETNFEQENTTAINQKVNYRWKSADPTKWKRNIELRKKRNCLPYKSKDGKLRAPKLPKNPKCSKNCRHKCTENFRQEQREEICKSYWSIQDFKQQKEFLLKRIIIKAVKTTKKCLPLEKQRSSSREYGFFKNQTSFERVCKNFFMSTLCISSGPIETAVKHLDENGSFSHIDHRGRRTPANKTSDDQLQDVKNHIESFPVLDSHYCRKQTAKKYLEPTLSILKMYDLYVQEMRNSNKIPVKLNVYKKVFGTQYNLAFFHPKKDQCSLCNKYQKDKTNMSIQNEYSQHIQRKEASYRSKELDKKKSEEDESFLCVTLDLQSLLQIPSTADSLMYYSRKLNLYNLSIYEFKPPQNNAHCMIWTEINGKRGSIEIASAIYLWIMKLPEVITHVTIYSDTCSGQNRNQYIAAFLLHLVQMHDTIKVIEQKYLESGHSFMEVDSMHSAIEKEKRFTEAYCITDWKRIMQRARSNRQNKNVTPYKVTELSYEDMIDVKTLASKIMKNKSISEGGETVCWLKIKCLRFEKTSPGLIKYRYDYDGPYKLLNTLCKPGRSTRRTPNSQMPTINPEDDIPRAYNQCLPITKQKKKDLLQLCKKNIIPKELHGWYESLPSSNDGQDRPPCTDSSDVDE